MAETGSGLLSTQQVSEKQAELVREFRFGLPKIERLPNEIVALLGIPEVAALLDLFFLPFFFLRAFNGKTLPALKILLNMVARGIRLHGKNLYGATSGNTGAGWGYIYRLFGAKKFVAVVKHGTSKGKLGQLYYSGAKIMFAPEGISTIEYARMLAQVDPDGVELNQYRDRASVEAHEIWTMPHVREFFLGEGIIPAMTFLPLGTTSTAVAANVLKETWPDFEIFGVAGFSEEEEVPGARTVPGLEVTGFDYQGVIDADHLLLGSQREAYRMSCQLGRNRIPAGPTSGFAVDASFNHFRKVYREEGMSGIRRYVRNGRIPVFYAFMDAFLGYSSDYKRILEGK